MTETEDAQNRSPFWGAPIATVIVVVLLLWFAYGIADILLLFFASIIAACYLRAIMDWSHDRLHVRRSTGLLIALVFTGAVLTAIGYLIGPPLISEATDLIRSLPELLAGVDNFVSRMFGRSTDASALSADATTERYLDSLVAWMTGYFTGAVHYVFEGATAVVHFASVLIMGIYLAIRPSTYRNGALALVPPVHRSLVDSMFDEMGVLLRGWIAGLLLAMASLGALSYVGYLLLGVPYALAFGVFTGLATIVPFFGSALSTLLPAFVILGEGETLRPLLVVLFGIFIHIAEGNLIAPLIMQRQIHLPPVLSILAVLIMSKLLGFIGLLIAVPVLGVVMVVVKRLYVQRILEGKGFRRSVRDGRGGDDFITRSGRAGSWIRRRSDRSPEE